MSKLLEKMRSDFQGSAEELLDRAQEIVKALNLAQEAGEGNERLLRHYVSMGVVDKPTRDGRDALYGFRHLLQFVAARRLLAEGFPLAKIAGYTGAVPTDALVDYLEKPDRTSEAQLLVAAFRSSAPSRQTAAQAARKLTPKPVPNVATGMGMVDVMHEMRDMEERVRLQIDAMQRKVRDMVSEAIDKMGSPGMGHGMDSMALKEALSHMSMVMDEAAHRFEALLKKPMALIERQMEQQRYMFEEAHKQKDFIERMFADLLREQRKEYQKLSELQMARMEELVVRVDELAAGRLLLKDKKEGAA